MKRSYESFHCMNVPDGALEVRCVHWPDATGLVPTKSQVCSRTERSPSIIQLGNSAQWRCMTQHCKNRSTTAVCVIWKTRHWIIHIHALKQESQQGKKGLLSYCQVQHCMFCTASTTESHIPWQLILPYFSYMNRYIV